MPARRAAAKQPAPGRAGAAASSTGAAASIAMPGQQNRVPPGVQLEADTLLGDYLQRKKLDLEAAASTVRRLHDSSRARDTGVHRCVLTALLGEWPLLSRYPEKVRTPPPPPPRTPWDFSDRLLVLLVCCSGAQALRPTVRAAYSDGPDDLRRHPGADAAAYVRGAAARLCRVKPEGESNPKRI